MSSNEEALIRNEKLFPVLQPHGQAKAVMERFACPHYIPWEVIAPHEKQAEINHNQSLEKLASRGGLDPIELIAVLKDRKYQTMHLDVAIAQLKKIVSNH